MEIIDGRKLSEEILAEIKKEVEALSFVPVFCDVLVGEDKASAQYVNMKKRRAESLGIKFYEAFFPISITTEELVEEIKKINQIPHMCGIIVQLPLPDSVDRRRVLDSINPAFDVDCLGEINENKFYNNTGEMAPPTALACIEILRKTGVSLVEKNILVLGYGNLVGKPVFKLLANMGLKPNLARSKTEGRESLIRQADVIISGIGQGHYLNDTMLKDGVILIDAGTSEESGAIVGDVDFELMRGLSGYVTPVPGGVGPVTVAMLFRNVLEVAKKKNAR